MSKRKSIFISIDMEGISGIVDWRQTGGENNEYSYGRKLMVGDLNAAIEGAINAGVKDIVVSDSHGGMKNVQPEEVHEAALLIRGSPKPDQMMAGIKEGFDAALYIGYHSMKGTENGVLAHTISGSSIDGIWINNREIGEFGLNAALAGAYGVPSIFISGDQAIADEAVSFVPDITTAIVKWGVGRQAAKCLHPRVARDLIRTKVTESINKKDSIKPLHFDGTINFKLRFSSSLGGDGASRLPYITRVDGRTVKAEFNDYKSALKGLLSAITIGGAVMRN